MPKVGEEEFEYTPEGIAEAKAKSLETGIPMSNAQERSETYQLGGKVKPPTAPSMPQYDEGGKVKKAPKYKGAPLKPEIKKPRKPGGHTTQGIFDQPGGVKGVLKRAAKTIKEKPIKDWWK